MRSAIVLAALLFALAIPAAALGQGAGDEQYQDPFGDEQSQTEPTPTATPPATPVPTQAPSTSSQAQPAPTATPVPSQGGGRQLPYTGAGAGLLALAGAALLGAGLALRRAVHER